MFTKYKSAIIIVGISLAIMLPAFIFGSGGDDLIFHTLWSEHFHQQILGGNLYPRWLHNINSGCGEPVFFFYPPLSFYLNSIVQILTGGILDSWYSMSISLLIAILIGNIFLYLWVKDITESKKYALCSVVIFTLLPYKSFLYIRLFLTLKQ
jgi:uncharacterized membrane protein